MKRQIQITVEIQELSDWHSMRLLLKALLRRHGLKCVGLSEPQPKSGIVSNERLPSVPVKSMEKFPNARWTPRTEVGAVVSDISTCSNLNTCEVQR